MCFINFLFSLLIACFIFQDTTAQKISAVANGENKTVPAYIDVLETSHQLICNTDWQHPPYPLLSWDVTNAPMAVDGIDFVKSNETTVAKILWLNFLKVSSNITGTYICIATGPNDTSYTNFEVTVNDDGISIGAIAAIAVGSLILALGALFATVIAAKRLGYISM